MPIASTYLLYFSVTHKEVSYENLPAVSLLVNSNSKLMFNH